MKQLIHFIKFGVPITFRTNKGLFFLPAFLRCETRSTQLTYRLKLGKSPRQRGKYTTEGILKDISAQTRCDNVTYFYGLRKQSNRHFM